MDEQIRAPEKLTEIPEHTRKWLASLEPEDITRFKKWSAFIVWAETTGRFGKILLFIAVTVFGAAATIAGGWDAVLKFLHMR